MPLKCPGLLSSCIFSSCITDLTWCSSWGFSEDFRNWAVKEFGSVKSMFTVWSSVGYGTILGVHKIIGTRVWFWMGSFRFVVRLWHVQFLLNKKNRPILFAFSEAAIGVWRRQFKVALLKGVQACLSDLWLPWALDAWSTKIRERCQRFESRTDKDVSKTSHLVAWAPW